MKRAYLGYIISFFILLAIIYASFPAIQEICIFLSYNALFFIDNSFSFSKAINPLFAWTIVFALLGLIIGLAKTVSIFKLHKKFYLYSFLGIILLLFLINTCSHPLKYNSSREVREEILWSNLNKQKSYSNSTLYINEFPEGKYISEIKLLQESALWDSASVSKSSQVWKLYCDKFKGNTNYSQARINYDKTLWSEISKVNTASAYSNYLKEFPNGVKSSLAQKKLNKYTPANKSVTESGSIISKEKAEITIPDSVKNVSSSTIKDKPAESNNSNSSRSNDYAKLELPGGIRYEGDIKNDLPNGYGSEIFPDKSSLQGFYINGKRDGEFTYKNSNGSEEKQMFKNGIRIEKSPQSSLANPAQTSNFIGPRKNGTGEVSKEAKEIFPDGTSLSGNYINGKREGDFIYTRKDGTTEKQVFRNGIRIK